MTENKSPVLLGVGDVGPVHGDMEDYATLVQPALDTGDIRFAQCERLYYPGDDASNSIDVDLGHRPLQTLVPTRQSTLRRRGAARWATSRP